MTERLTVGCLGAGYFAAFHHEAWKRHPDVDLIAVADHDLDKAQAVGVSAYQSLDAMLAAEVPDIIDLIVPPVAHKDVVTAAVAAGPKAIICQKPFGTSLQEAKELTGLAQKAGIPLIIHENFRFQPWYRAAKSVMEAGELGTVHQVSFRIRPGDGQGPRAYLDRQPYFQKMPRLLIHETGVHWVDTFRYLMGPITGVYADIRKMNPVIAGEDACHVVFDFAQGKRALLDGNRHLDHAADNPRTTMGEALIEGTEGTLTIDGWGNVQLRRFGETTSETVLSPQKWSSFGGDCVYALQAHVVDGLKGAGNFENQARDYLTVRQVEDALYRSAQERRFVEVTV